MTSRLDRLFILLESGSSAVTRRAAAKQIGEVQKLYPHELHTLLNRLISYLHSNCWDTRIAAAQTVEAILINVPKWQPELQVHSSKLNIKREIKKEEQSINAADEENSSQSNDSSATTNTTVSTVNSEHNKQDLYLNFAKFNLEQVLSNGARLTSSEGMEFDFNDDAGGSLCTTNDSAAERLTRQRILINEKLGLTQASKLGVNLTDIISDEDVMRNNSNYNTNDEKVPVEHILNIKTTFKPEKSSHNGQQLSCREINRAKRKARQNALLGSVGGYHFSGSNEEPEKKKLKGSENFKNQEIYYSLNDPVPDVTDMWIDAVYWPLEGFCGRLYIDLFNAKWEVRHGAATALRELINFHGAGAGKTTYMSQDEMELYHNMWLEDASIRLICVLCLDRFGDFISDQVVAPVRETCAQVLGTVVKEMPASKVSEVVRILRSLVKEREWEVRHGGLLGLKYIFVVREDLLPTYLPQTLSDILGGLFDKVDDVGAVAASTLTPVASWFPRLLNASEVSSIVKMLWDLLLHQDELTSASNSFMSLLAAILCLPDASQWIQMEPMSELIPRLWPFLTHSTSSVRKSTLITLQTLTSSIKHKSSEIKKTDEIFVGENKFSFDSKKLKLNFGVIDWPWKLLQDALRHIYQRILVEPIADIQKLAKAVWINLIENSDLSALLHAACPYVSSWMCLAMQPPRLAFDPSVLIYADNSAPNVASSGERKQPLRGGTCDWAVFPINTQQHKLYLGGSESTPWEVREQNYMRARILAAESLGILSKYLIQPAPGIIYTEDMENPMDCYVKVLLGHLNSKSAVQRTVCSLIIAFWAQNDPSIGPGPEKLVKKLQSCVMECMYYDEVAVSCTRLLQEAHDLIATFTQYMVPITDVDHTKVLTLEDIDILTTKALSVNLANYSLKSKISETLDNRRKSLKNSLQQTSSEQNGYNISTQAALAGAIICLKCLPEKLNPVVRPLMESIKREECLLLQELSAEFLVLLMAQISDRNPSPNPKIFTNLSTLLKSDAEFTPKIIKANSSLKQTPLVSSAVDSYKCIYYGILSLQQSTNQSTSLKGTAAAAATTKMTTAVTVAHRGPGRPPLHESASQAIIQAASCSCSNEDQEMLKYCRVQRLGATSAISKLYRLLGSKLLESIPVVEQLMFTRLKLYVEQCPNMTVLSDEIIDVVECNDLVTTLQLLETAGPFLHNSLHELLFQLLDALGITACHPLKSLRHMSARCLATLADIDPVRTMDFVVNRILVLLGRIGNVIDRQGGIEVVQRIAERLHIKIVPYIVVLVVPLLGCMSDPDECVRLLATHCFATLVQLMPLDDARFASGDSKDLKSRKTQDRQFLQYLFNPKTIPDYKVPVALNVTLRSYQQAGVNWLWFLNKYNLHGILCDDMGLGKTLQTICIITGDHYERQHNENAEDLPSLVICPPTLTGHWVYEIEKFLSNSNVLRPLHYVGQPSNREFLRTRIDAKKYNLVVASYDAVRKDIDFISRIHWNYCVLDEGHIIKNSKTKSSKAIKLLKAKHRLILSGTPIQNNVLELWSLFDFLMPGFLGTEREFIGRYSRPILASREAKSSRKDQEAGVLAMESLHRQVLPFLLRRVKEDVLNDLPPKITQDLLCELSPLQERLYEDFSRLHLNTNMTGSLDDLHNDNKGSAKGHIFYALRYLQNVCNHPKLVLNPKHPEYGRIEEELLQQQTTLDDIQHSAKLPALKQLLLDCGIGIQTESVSHHRALIFCQLKAMLDIVEKDLLQKHLPSVTYLRLDGSVPAIMRHDIVQNFNTDPSIDVLLLTTQVGGLGLNLTGADTVIFVEHDWNPMKDLQAMDRAHRIGQKKVVNVYRLITRKSLEEKIMSLQKFKLLTANTIVSTENNSLDTMATGQILDLFNLGGAERSKTEKKEKHQNNSNASEHLSLNAVIENLPELWSEQQYDEEYDLSNFIQTLKKSS